MDSDKALRALGVVGLRLAVAFDAEELEGHFAQDAAGVPKRQRKIAIDAVAHRTALGAHAQRLGDVQFAVPGDHDVGIERMDNFGGKRATARHHDKQRGNAQQVFHRGARSTCGTARSPASRTSKKACSETTAPAS
jgi:hypothetical protein